MGAKMTLTKTEMIVRDLDKDILNNPNHITRRLFTVYLDGSYGQGVEWYERTKELSFGQIKKGYAYSANFIWSNRTFFGPWPKK